MNRSNSFPCSSKISVWLAILEESNDLMGRLDLIHESVEGVLSGDGDEWKYQYK